ncbi:hypothetical protein [Pararhodospirillum oryzae]|uniref:Uncharacterized protein n=1 Tax=Pararhodospirillum oryzae TaxID=478448 RepID=A0A512HAI0_9PROT|nr:hypothetical protein [Pararhodospirillum oryzae]GEO82461.1 hypothetical protein ROR02_25920 [Pararhodospirillum oryzae]
MTTTPPVSASASAATSTARPSSSSPRSIVDEALAKALDELDAGEALHTATREIARNADSLMETIRKARKARDIEQQRQKIAQAKAQLKALQGQIRSAVASGDTDRAAALARQIAQIARTVRQAMNTLTGLGERSGGSGGSSGNAAASAGSGTGADATDSADGSEKAASAAAQAASQDTSDKNSTGSGKDSGTDAGAAAEATPGAAQGVDPSALGKVPSDEDNEKARQEGLREGREALAWLRRLIDLLALAESTSDDPATSDARRELHTALSDARAEVAAVPATVELVV